MLKKIHYSGNKKGHCSLVHPCRDVGWGIRDLRWENGVHHIRLQVKNNERNHILQYFLILESKNQQEREEPFSLLCKFWVSIDYFILFKIKEQSAGIHYLHCEMIVCSTTLGLWHFCAAPHRKRVINGLYFQWLTKSLIKWSIRLGSCLSVCILCQLINRSHSIGDFLP